MALAIALLPFALGACNSGGGDNGSQTLVVGSFVSNPTTGAPFFVDPNQGGEATRLRLDELSWGRLVDVFGVDANGNVDPIATMTNLVINENQPLNLAKAVLDINPISQQARLIVQRQVGEPEPSPGAGDFESVLREMKSGLPPIAPKNDDGSAAEPFSFMARNSTLVLRFDDVLADDATTLADLSNRIKVLVGYAPTTPFSTRMIFDSNHGTLVSGVFHSTRVLIDMTVSETEAVAMMNTVPVNSLGLPSSLATTGQPNVSVRIPSRIDFASTQFEVLRNLTGSPMATSSNGPIDFSSPTLDIVRAMRAGNSVDVNNGFLLDLNAPQIVGGFVMTLPQVLDDPTITPTGFNFLVDVTFDSSCQTRPVVGDILSVGNNFLEVSAAAGSPNGQGQVFNVKARLLTNTAVNPNVLLGTGLFLTTWKPGKATKECFVSFAPKPNVLPATGVQPASQILIRFTEPMDPASVLPFDTFIISEGTAANSNPTATTITVGQIQPSADLREYVYTSSLPFKHNTGTSDPYHILLGGGPSGVTDLAGNALLDSIPSLDFTMDPISPVEASGNIVLRFGSTDEWTQDDNNPNEVYQDLRGQFFYDLTNEVIRPRQALRFPETPADRGNPIPGIMAPFPPGVQTPLSPLGSKLHALWRYCDFGWLADDETKYNLDIEGLYWSPAGGQVISDFYEDFEIRLSHSIFLPDEWLNNGLLPQWQGSGLINKPNPYTDNIMVDPFSIQEVVHSRGLGYQVNPVDLVINSNGTPLIPFPLHRTPGAPKNPYLWRDTTTSTLGAPRGNGIPLSIEWSDQQNGVNLYGDGMNPGPFYRVDEVPSIGLPLLMEFRCYPSNTGIGLNAFDINLATNSSAIPNFRSYSTGGVNTAGIQISKDPDLEDVPTGGFNPTSNPAGRPTARVADNSFYIGAIDYVVRVSTVHSVWLNTTQSAPNFEAVVVEPNPSVQPLGTSVAIDFRGATGFTAGTGPSGNNVDMFRSSGLDAYGNTSWRVWAPKVKFFNQTSTWTSDIDQVDGAQYLQLRFAFINNVDTMLEPELSAIGVAYRN